MYEDELGIIKLAHTDCFAPALETSKTADMEKGDIPKTQNKRRCKVVDEDRLQSNFKGDFITL